MKKFTSSAKSAAINTFKELSEVVDGRTLPKAMGPLFYLRRDMNHYRATYDSFLSRADPNKPAYLFFDGASKQNPGPAGAGFAIVDDSNNVYGAFSVNTLKATNNEAEYMAALFGVYCARLASRTTCKENRHPKLDVDRRQQSGDRPPDRENAVEGTEPDALLLPSNFWSDIPATPPVQRAGKGGVLAREERRKQNSRRSGQQGRQEVHRAHDTRESTSGADQP